MDMDMGMTRLLWMKIISRGGYGVVDVDESGGIYVIPTMEAGRRESRLHEVDSLIKTLACNSFVPRP